MYHLPKFFLSSLLFLAFSGILNAQFREGSRPPHSGESVKDNEEITSPGAGALSYVVPSTLMVTGLGVHFLARDVDFAVKDWARNTWRGDRPERNFDNYIQYTPYILDIGLGLAGARAKHGFADRFTECALSLALLGIVSGSMKEIIDSPRPNMANNQSFPSGHTDLVFCGAELVRMEYGWGWGSAAYLVAFTVGGMRLYNNWHWLSDVVFGAGLGIICANAGGRMLEPFKRFAGIDRSDAAGLSVAPGYDPVSGSPTVALALRF